MILYNLNFVYPYVYKYNNCIAYIKKSRICSLYFNFVYIVLQLIIFVYKSQELTDENNTLILLIRIFILIDNNNNILYYILKCFILPFYYIVIIFLKYKLI